MGFYLMFVFNSQHELNKGEMLNLIAGGQKFVQSMNEGFIGFRPPLLPDYSTRYCVLHSLEVSPS